MGNQTAMICPDCGVEMNFHAEKIDYEIALDGAQAADPDFGGVVEQVHTCTRCGKTATRPEKGDGSQ